MGDIATEIYSGNEVTKAQLGTGDYPAIKCGDVNSGLPIHFSNCISFVNLNLIQKPKFFENKDILIGVLAHKIEAIGRAIIYLGGQKCILGNDVVALRSNQNQKYLTYILSSKFCRKQIEKSAIPGTVVHLYSKDLKKIKIPLPPRHVQDLIADYLDHWTNLEQELEKELADRKKQYQHYKERILTSEKDKWGSTTISKIVEDLFVGNEVYNIQLNTGNYPAIRCGDVNSSLGRIFTKCISFVDASIIKNKRYFENGDILVSHLGDKNTVASCIAYLGHEECILGNSVYALRHKQNPSYLAYALSSKFCRQQIEQMCAKGALCSFSLRSTRKLKIPLPPLEEQEIIVSKLDKFRTITEDLEEGIPKLLTQTRQQYEFYKEEILKFE